MKVHLLRPYALPFHSGNRHFSRALLALFLLILFPLTGGAAGPERVSFDLNNDWAFFRGDLPGGEQENLDDSSWIPVVIPHVMQLEKKHCGGDFIYDGTGWYRRYLAVPEDCRDKRAALKFEGVMSSCDVFLNGEKVGEHHGGYVGFVIDLTGKLHPDKPNVLALRVSAENDPLTPPGKPQGQLDFYYYSGIYRDVTLEFTGSVFITDELEEDVVAGGGQFITYPEATPENAVVQVLTHIRNTGGKSRHLRVVTELIDSCGRIAAHSSVPFHALKESASAVSQTLSFAGAELWHPEHPYLYQLKTALVEGRKVVDEKTTSIGIRRIRYDAKEGFFINGEKLYMRGANRHQAFAHIGDAAPNSMQVRDVIQLKKGGFNAVRAAHYPQDPAFLDACDRYGLLVVECIPGWQYFNEDSTFVKRLLEVGRKMIRRDRNRPSVVLWETALNESRYPASLAEEIWTLAHEEFPGDQMYTSGDYYRHNELEPYHEVFYKMVRDFPADGNVMTNDPHNLLYFKPVITREWGDGVGEKPRVSLEENEEEQMRQCRSRITQLEGDGYFDWCMLDANPSMAGHFVWSFNDYARGNQETTLYCGVVDINRYPKPSYYLLQSMRDASVSQPGLFEGPMVHIASYNASPAYSSSTTDVTVFSNCDEVRLYRNGRLAGVQTREERAALYPNIVSKGGSPSFVFDLGGYEAGELLAEGLIQGKTVARHEVGTPGKPHHLELDIRTEGIDPVADGSDLIPVYCRVMDEKGNFVYDARETVTFSAEGEGKVVGAGIPRLGISPQQTEGGVAFAFVRTTDKAGKIVIRAESDGLESGIAEITSVPFEGKRLPGASHRIFSGHEEDNVLLKAVTWEQEILKSPRLPLHCVTASGSQADFPSENVYDGDDRTWWMAADGSFPQTLTLELAKPAKVQASRIVFQKDSSTYTYVVEISRNGQDWTELYRKECTGWDMKPVRINRYLKYFRVTVLGSTEGRAAVSEVSLY